MPITITSASHKGGCAKTTSFANLGVALAEPDARVLLSTPTRRPT